MTTATPTTAKPTPRSTSTTPKAEGKLICASCNPSGARPVGEDIGTPLNEPPYWAAASLPAWQNTLYASRALSDDGSRLFFQATDALVPRDTNGRQDVYQWEAPAPGRCAPTDPRYVPAAGGCVSLISSGQSSRAVEFLDASPDGHDVFFATLASLLGPDYGLVDVYDARVGGGFPEPQPPAPECEGEACQTRARRTAGEHPGELRLPGPRQPRQDQGQALREGQGAPPRALREEGPPPPQAPPRPPPPPRQAWQGQAGQEQAPQQRRQAGWGTMSARALAALCAALLAAAALCALPANAGAAVGLSEFDVSFTGPEGSPLTQAGAHPYAMSTTFAVNTKEGPEGGTVPDEAVKDLLIAQVPGFAGIPTAVPRCSSLDFLQLVPSHPEVPECPDSTAVGVAEVTIGLSGGQQTFKAPLYNLLPSPGSVARLGFRVQSVPVVVDVGISQSPPYNVIATSANISQVLEFFAGKVTIWGVPASHAHDDERGACAGFDGASLAPCEAGVAEVPFLTLPRACAGPLPTTYALDSWQVPGAFTAGHSLTAPTMSGCGRLAFSPRASARPTSSSAESASGLEFDLDVSDEGLTNPEGLAAADIEKTVLALPAGITANPSAAAGLGTCSLAQYQEASLAGPPARGTQSSAPWKRPPRSCRAPPWRARSTSPSQTTRPPPATRTPSTRCWRSTW